MELHPTDYAKNISYNYTRKHAMQIFGRSTRVPAQNQQKVVFSKTGNEIASRIGQTHPDTASYASRNSCRELIQTTDRLVKRNSCVYKQQIFHQLLFSGGIGAS